MGELVLVVLPPHKWIWVHWEALHCSVMLHLLIHHFRQRLGWWWWCLMRNYLQTYKTSQVTYVTMVPRVGNETLRPLGVATGNALSVTRSEDTYEKNTTCWPATAHDVTTGVPQYKCRREDTSSASSSEACVRSMAQSPGDAVSRSPLGEPWLHT